MRNSLLPACAALALIALPAHAANISVSDAWFRALPANIPAGGYFTLRNAGSTAATLTGAQSSACGMLMLHRSQDTGGMSSMGDVSEVDVPAGGSVAFAPGGYHLMCMDAKLKPGIPVAVTLLFKDGAKLAASFAVRNAAGK